MNQRIYEEKNQKAIKTTTSTHIEEIIDNSSLGYSKSQSEGFNEETELITTVKATVLPKNDIQQKRHRAHHTKQFPDNLENKKDNFQLSLEQQINSLEIEQVLII